MRIAAEDGLRSACERIETVPASIMNIAWRRTWRNAALFRNTGRIMRISYGNASIWPPPKDFNKSCSSPARTR